MSDVTRILQSIEDGDPRAAEQLLPLVYDELRKLAAAKMAQEKPGQTLQATALVHEAYMRLVDTENAQPWNGRGHFFAAAAEAMRRILIQNARKRDSLKRGGDLHRLTFNADFAAFIGPTDRMLELDEALSAFELADPVKAQLVKLRFFAGLSIAEAAMAMQISETTADRYWAYARSWMQREMSAESGSDGS